MFRDLDADGVKVTAYMTAHLNIDGDVFKDAAEVGTQMLKNGLNSLRLCRKTTGLETPMDLRWQAYIV